MRGRGRPECRLEVGHRPRPGRGPRCRAVPAATSCSIRCTGQAGGVPKCSASVPGRRRRRRWTPAPCSCPRAAVTSGSATAQARRRPARAELARRSPGEELAGPTASRRSRLGLGERASSARRCGAGLAGTSDFGSRARSRRGDADHDCGQQPPQPRRRRLVVCPSPSADPSADRRTRRSAASETRIGRPHGRSLGRLPRATGQKALVGSSRLGLGRVLGLLLRRLGRLRLVGVLRAIACASGSAARRSGSGSALPRRGLPRRRRQQGRRRGAARRRDAATVQRMAHLRCRATGPVFDPVGRRPGGHHPY